MFTDLILDCFLVPLPCYCLFSEHFLFFHLLLFCISARHQS